jgi:uncharacterized membrane protein
MNSKIILYFFLAIMAIMIIAAIVFPSALDGFINRPGMGRHLLFIHVVAVTIFFANALIGILWEMRSLASGKKDIILHTYETVSWLDARFSSPMIIISLIGGILLSIRMGNIWEIGWLAWGFILFVLSGVVWVISDIPSQYKIKARLEKVDPAAETLPDEVMGLLRTRLWISLAGVLPLAAVFYLMIYKPEITAPASWF